MKPFIRPPSKPTPGGKPDKGPNKPVKPKPSIPGSDPGGEGEDDAVPVVEIVDDKDLDFTKLENVDKILNKYKN